MKYPIEVIRAVLLDTSVYIQAADVNEEPIRITYVCIDDCEYFIGIGEETGDNYQINFVEVDLDNDMFYTLSVLDVSKYGATAAG